MKSQKPANSDSVGHRQPALLLSTAYLPPVHYVAKMMQYEVVWIEACEHFIKQTYRNRAVILAANGTEPLIIPVVKGRNGKQPIKDIEIAYDKPWQHVHWHAIVSAYRSSAFFELLEADFSPFYHKKFRFLFDLNMELLQVILGIMEINTTVSLTKAFEEAPAGSLNLRDVIKPRETGQNIDPCYHPYSYSQVFDDKFGFVPNLSIIDLLFNCGPLSYEILLKSHS